MIPGRHVVHVRRPRVAVDARVEDNGRVKLPRETGRDRKAGRTAADDEHVNKRGSRHGRKRKDPEAMMRDIQVKVLSVFYVAVFGNGKPWRTVKLNWFSDGVRGLLLSSEAVNNP